MIDAHIHYLLRDGEEKKILESMDAGGIEKSVILPLPPLKFQNACTAGNDEVYSLCQRHSDRLTFGVFANPLEANTLEEVRRYAELGAVVCKIVPTLGFYPDAPECMPLYELLAELQLPVIAHTGGTNLPYWENKKRQALSSHWADPIRFDGLSRQFPELNWILAHMGFPWCVNAWFVAAVNQNVYLDISGGSFWLTALPQMYDSCGCQVPIDFNKVIWGSDNCLPPAEHVTFSKKLLNDLGCNEKYHPAIFANTARTLFKI